MDATCHCAGWQQYFLALSHLMLHGADSFELLPWMGTVQAVFPNPLAE
jgi:hypothetical protein